MRSLAVMIMLLAFGARAEDLYELSTAGTTAKVKAGDRGTLVIAFTMKPGAHVSDEAPLKLALGGEGLAFDKAALTLADSVGVKQSGEAYAAPRFEVGFRPAAGARAIDAKLSFFVCTATLCLRQTRTMSVPLEVL